MELKPLVVLTVYSILVLAEICESRLNKIFKPKHHCASEVLCNTTKFYPREGDQEDPGGATRRSSSPSPGPVIEPGEMLQVPQMRNSMDEYQEVNMCRTRRVTVVPKTGFDVET
ncbi:hypothetical protein NQ318_009962 [Aromia moschata]|uniref:Uncharacterized protein n=1 Tax=Aromia moschata TaxID=1265417 RepID=A0AAV8X4J0_9CUCU|nr:hypothetical protein NQ318_009962 [Aromia moschata]